MSKAANVAFEKSNVFDPHFSSTNPFHRILKQVGNKKMREDKTSWSPVQWMLSSLGVCLLSSDLEPKPQNSPGL